MEVTAITLTDHEFNAVRDLLYREAGISLTTEKKALVCSRLEKHLRRLGLRSYQDYVSLVTDPQQSEELRTAINVLTTNETYFFREPKHFKLLREWLRATDKPDRFWRIWSGASSTGEEPYSIAMTLADAIPSGRWEVIGSDINTRVLAKAGMGVYPMERIDDLPPDYLKRYCLKGVGPEEGNFLMDKKIRERVKFIHLNLNGTLPPIGKFDVIFLRNVLIYFDVETKRRVIERVTQHLNIGGHFVVSHSESLHGLAPHLVQEVPSVYRKDK